MFAALHPLITKHSIATLAAATGSATAVVALPPASAAVVVAGAVLLCGARHAPTGPRDHALRRHVAICRRREERALVVVARAPGRRRSMASDLRISDSAVAVSHRRGSVLVAVIDRHEHSLERITERLREKHGAQLTIGWTTFPDDGLTLDTLVALAASRARPVPCAGWRLSARRTMGERK